MTDERLAELRALANAVGPEPWQIRVAEDLEGEQSIFVVRNDEGAEYTVAHIGLDIPRTELGEDPRADAAFIAASRTAIPELLDEIERLRIKGVSREGSDDDFWIALREAINAGDERAIKYLRGLADLAPQLVAPTDAPTTTTILSTGPARYRRAVVVECDSAGSTVPQENDASGGSHKT